MAVAEDLHPDFLIPEHVVPDNEPCRLDELRLFFCPPIISRFVGFCNSKRKKTRPEPQKTT